MASPPSEEAPSLSERRGRDPRPGRACVGRSRGVLRGWGGGIQPGEGQGAGPVQRFPAWAQEPARPGAHRSPAGKAGKPQFEAAIESLLRSSEHRVRHSQKYIVELQRDLGLSPGPPRS